MLPALRERPSIEPHLIFVWHAYALLRTDRQIGMDRGPIMFSSIDAFALRYGIDDVDEFDRFADLIRAMDEAERGFKPSS